MGGEGGGLLGAFSLRVFFFSFSRVASFGDSPLGGSTLSFFALAKRHISPAFVRPINLRTSDRSYKVLCHFAKLHTPPPRSPVLTLCY
jgi:hypothetical protein